MSRYIESEWLKGRVHNVTLANGALHGCIDKLDIHEAPSIDIVRCSECKHHEDFPTGISPLTCSLVWGGVFENDFCSYGERKVSEKPTSSEKPNNLERSDE